MLARDEFRQAVAALVLAYRDVFHFRRNNAFARVVHLRNVGAGLGAPWMALEIEAQLRKFRIGSAAASIRRSKVMQQFGVVAPLYPFFAQRREAGTNVDFRRRVGVRPRRVVDVNRRIFFSAHFSRRIRLADFTHRHPDIGARALDVDLARIGQRLDGRFIDMRCRAQEFGIGVHVCSSLCEHRQARRGEAWELAPRFPAAALSASGSKGLSHPANDSIPACQDP